MRIGIDARAAMENTDGIGRYAFELLRVYAGMDHDDTYVVLKNAGTRLSFAADERFRELVVPLARFGVREQFALPRLLNGLRLDVFHSLHASLPLWYGGVEVMTVHDILPMVYPWSYGRNAAKNAIASKYFGALLRASARRSTLTIVDSNHTARDMCALLGTDPGEIRRIYLGIDHLHVASAGAQAGNGSQIPGGGPFILTVTNFRPHKNTAKLLEAFRIVRQTMPGLTLAVAGDDPKDRARALGNRRELESEGIRILGFVSDQTLAMLMARAEAFVFPSLYEGFGFPVLEAMAAGTPVITSGAASLLELGGDAVVYVDPLDERDIAGAVLRVCASRDLQDDLRSRGTRQASRFRWRETAMQTLEVYEEAVCLRGGRPR